LFEKGDEIIEPAGIKMVYFWLYWNGFDGIGMFQFRWFWNEFDDIGIVQF
jgi:hypothetical protein